MVGNRARIRGRVFRVGHSAKSNTYFLNFGPSRKRSQQLFLRRQRTCSKRIDFSRRHSRAKRLNFMEKSKIIPSTDWNSSSRIRHRSNCWIELGVVTPWSRIVGL